ncbi:16S rRNA (guanine(966)-N(2))-methyltransferase RsmD [Francisella philomiragia]|uniref:Ribosomal RNA small subunit methyltransferase D n=1 Tax=Francisella philomiragia TaxID=28110 RepID=A0ABS1GAS9_9GAMM|nr:16S rRNA (guanine(966)-N(2))-methyltransferase RsmD [Francisella philomiragia]AJI56118.1 16S rRNA (guanine(966)-N(2))-methyltransferase RsmD [Francisella philomiragia]MBK2093894.1 16S rRNA (guanine(966)-N(2))-methyltransferase RsmD [Francisella philomiragia]MBK2106988.1 16S rRNA (guanine(966)-N(2))-methyltransferase RsmD [Francisella philomiragia]MBK2252649.1 16S rRNA (guanine(966)-N(2))-methyltransferase RsmD [Francisella philomiragia]MBK2256364.1 16S rRNA (guanine(966)-N(2))-methyltransfe
MKTNTIRIISGKYKNRRLKFPNVNGLRPTSDQLKETIFNWLAPYIHDSICIDAFAGSGSLGIESISRGASKAIFYELNFKALQQIKENINTLEIQNYEIYKTDSIKALANFDPCNSRLIIFLDPPFNKNIIPKALESILKNQNIPNETLVYVETEKTAEYNLDGFDILKEKTTSNISAKLIIKNDLNSKNNL